MSAFVAHDDPRLGRYSSQDVIGEVTEAIHRRLLDSYDINDRPPRMEEDLKFVPKDREEVIYVYMYRLAQNPNLNRQKRLKLAPVEVKDPITGTTEFFYHRPPLLLDLFYMIGVHSKFRSDAERLMGWVMLTLYATPRLVYRPRRFILPDGRIVDNLGRPWDPTGPTDIEGLHIEKVSLAQVDDMTIGDAVNFFTLHEAPFRPWLTYRARVALDGPLMSAEGGSEIAMGPLDRDFLEPQSVPDPTPTLQRRSGRIQGPKPNTSVPKPPGPPSRGLVTRAELAQKRDSAKNQE